MPVNTIERKIIASGVEVSKNNTPADPHMHPEIPEKITAATPQRRILSLLILKSSFVRLLNLTVKKNRKNVIAYIRASQTNNT